MEELEQSIRAFEQWQAERSARRMRIAALLRHGMSKQEPVRPVRYAGVLNSLDEFGKQVSNGLHTR